MPCLTAEDDHDEREQELAMARYHDEGKRERDEVCGESEKARMPAFRCAGHRAIAFAPLGT
uniref:Uncharacterized protein n=1 Tax=Bradyrhizobium amphicarpaeae TaxID=1404768 RepID=A0A2U8Q267_9BRAD|nr:hypothetical protein CIT40_31040 [Bradyrhizobium amphicarpaeae]